MVRRTFCQLLLAFPLPRALELSWECTCVFMEAYAIVGGAISARFGQGLRTRAGPKTATSPVCCPPPFPVQARPKEGPEHLARPPAPRGLSQQQAQRCWGQRHAAVAGVRDGAVPREDRSKAKQLRTMAKDILAGVKAVAEQKVWYTAFHGMRLGNRWWVCVWCWWRLWSLDCWFLFGTHLQVP